MKSIAAPLSQGWGKDLIRLCMWHGDGSINEGYDHHWYYYSGAIESDNFDLTENKT